MRILARARWWPRDGSCKLSSVVSFVNGWEPSSERPRTRYFRIPNWIVGCDIASFGLTICFDKTYSAQQRRQASASRPQKCESRAFWKLTKTEMYITLLRWDRVWLQPLCQNIRSGAPSSIAWRLKREGDRSTIHACIQDLFWLSYG